MLKEGNQKGGGIKCFEGKVHGVEMFTLTPFLFGNC